MKWKRTFDSMVALEDNLLILFYALVALAIIAALGIALWKPVLHRAWRYLVIWWERDKIAERDAQRMRTLRKQAEAEIAGEAQAPASTEAVSPLSPSTEPITVYQRLQK